LKVGKLTKISGESFSSTVTAESGFDETNITNENSRKKWKVKNGAVTLNIQFTGTTAECICLFNCNIKTDITIKTYSSYPSTVIETKTITVSQLTGFQSKNALFELTDTSTTIVAIDLVFTSTDTAFYTSVGYLWMGDLIDFGCVENMQPVDDSDDQATVTRAGTTDVKRRYNFQEYSVTLKKENVYETIRAVWRTILTDGFGTKRPFIIDESFLTSSELLLGIFDSPKAGYDIENQFSSTDNLTQFTFGIREVF
jgi:hypothetical protein